MFSFVFNQLSEQTIDWEIIINKHSIECSKTNAEIISKKISDFNSSIKDNLKNQQIQDTFSINIPELNNSLICSDSDYQYFYNILNLVPVKISATNKEILKIFAKEFEIEELINIIDMFEASNNLIENDEMIQILQEVSNAMINISDDNYEETMNRLILINNEKIKEDSNDFFYNIFLTSCSIRIEKIEMFMNFLKEFETRTNGNQFKYFKDMILLELKDNPTSNDVFFVVRHLYGIHEISEEKIISTFATNEEMKSFFRKDFSKKYKLILFDKYDLAEELKENEIRFFFNQPKKPGLIRDKINKMSKDELIEYSKTGYDPSKIYQSIKNDDIDLFSQLINEKSEENKFNDEILTLIFERSHFLLGAGYPINYIDLACFYGSEKIFNYILLNVDPQKVLTSHECILAFLNGNISIIHKILEYCIMKKQLLHSCILISIRNHHNEVFEWLIETYNPFESNFNETDYLRVAIQFNNFEAFSYLFSIGIDYTPLFSLSMLYNNFYLTKAAMKLPYNCNNSSKKLKMDYKSPYFYEIENVLF